MIVGVNHAQVNVSPESLDAAREFYIGFLGLREIDRPKTFKSPGIWMNAGTFEFHIGVEEGVDRARTRAHLAFEVNDVKLWRKKVESRGWEITDQPKIPNCDRFHFRDPFGNNIELIQKTSM